MKRVVRMLFLIHRYLGIGVGLVLLLWCLSGFVMMYVQYPELDAAETAALLPALDFTDCCTTPEQVVEVSERFSQASIEMLGTSPVLRFTGPDGAPWTVDMQQGRLLEAVGERQAHAISEAFARREGYPAARLVEQLDVDQWTVYGSYNAYRPFYKFAAGDAAGTQWYVSGKTGQIVQITDSSVRLWNYLGSVVHWLYPTLIRQNTWLWAQTVIWLSLVGGFLTLTGLYIGLRQYLQTRRRKGKVSPYRGLALWHHYAGLFFGVLTLTWVLSGTLSMNPWGALEGSGARTESQRLQGAAMSWEDLQEIAASLAGADLPESLVRIQAYPYNGEPFLLMESRDGSRVRYGTDTLQPVQMTSAERQQAAQRMLGSPPLSAELMTSEDAYYYGHHQQASLPVFRVIAADEQQTRYYLDAVTGRIAGKVDENVRWYRWLFYAFHRGDFSAAVRARPVWDLLMWSLLLGVTLVCATGTWMGFRRLLRKKASSG